MGPRAEPEVYWVSDPVGDQVDRADLYVNSPAKAQAMQKDNKSPKKQAKQSPTTQMSKNEMKEKKPAKKNNEPKPLKKSASRRRISGFLSYKKKNTRTKPLPPPAKAGEDIQLWTEMSWENKTGANKKGFESSSIAEDGTVQTGENAEGENEPQYRTESDLLGSLQVPNRRYFGVQTLRAISNYQITGIPLSHFPDFIVALAMTKKACALANLSIGSLPADIVDPILTACDDIIGGELHDEFLVDMVQGGAGTSTNMNANEVIANRALELMGHQKGSYEHIHPNDHVNKSQSTNDFYPTACKLGILIKGRTFIRSMQELVTIFRAKAEEFKGVLKMGRTQLQDAVPMTLGQEFNSFANVIARDIDVLRNNARRLMSVNLGGTAIGTGICANPAFGVKACEELSRISGFKFELSEDLIEASSCVDAMVMYHGTLRRVAAKVSKICSDLRILSSGPRCGFGEINLPPMAPGSSIMPGKVNPVIPEVVNQVAFAVCGNDVTVMMAAEHGQLQLNVMEPVIMFRIMQSVDMLSRAFDTLGHRCISGITANEEHCAKLVTNSISIVTALLPVIGYKNASSASKKALKEGLSVGDVVVNEGYLTRDRLEAILQPENMIGSSKLSQVEMASPTPRLPGSMNG
jgi:aspartate ammonia-lyase